MQINVDLMELLLALLVLVGIVFGIFLIVLVFRLAQAMKNIKKLTDDIHDPVTKTVDQLPDMIRKVDEITAAANENVPEILSDASTITGTARAGVVAVGTAAENVSEGVSSLFGKAKHQADSIASIVDVVGQVMSIVGLFVHRDKGKKKKRR